MAHEERTDRDSKDKVRSEVSDRLAGKKTKEEVNYRSKNQGSKESCAECEFYLDSSKDSSSCKKVAGLVYAEDTCDEFVSRKKEHATQEGQGDRVQPSISIEVLLNAGRSK